MTLSTRFIVKGRPEPQRRARATTRGGHVRMIDDPKNQAYADKIRWAWLAAGRDDHGQAPIMLTLTAVFPRPQGHFKKDGTLSAAGLRAPSYVSTPDADNIAKAVCDALNGNAFHDDRQVVGLKVTKLWAEQQGDPGRLIVQIDSYANEQEEAE